MLCLVAGMMGSGKTLYLTIKATELAQKNIPILANFKINVKTWQPLVPEDILSEKEDDGKEKVMMIDEAYVWLESRTSSKDINRYMSYLLYQSRKRNMDIYITAQQLRSIDVRFRNMAEVVVMCERTKNGFIYNRYFIKQTGIVKSRKFLPLEEAKKYFNKYDTFQVINPANVKELAVGFILNDPDKVAKMVREAAVKIGKAGSKDEVELKVMQLGYPKQIARYVYAQLKMMENGE